MQYNFTRKTPGKHLKLTRKPCIYYKKYTRNIPEISGITCKLQVFPSETGVSVKYWIYRVKNMKWWWKMAHELEMVDKL